METVFKYQQNYESFEEMASDRFIEQQKFIHDKELYLFNRGITSRREHQNQFEDSRKSKTENVI